MISRRIADLNQISEYYIHDDPSLPSEEHQNLIKIINFVYPQKIFKGYLQDLKGLTKDKIVISTKAGFSEGLDRTRILHVYDANKEWGSHSCILSLIQNQLQDHYGEFNRDLWGKYIEYHGRKLDLTSEQKSKFVSPNVRIRRLGISGIQRFIPVFEKTGYHLNRARCLGHSYVSDDLNCFTKEDFSKIKQVSQRLSDEHSKQLYHDVIFGDPIRLWKNYYELLVDLPQYMHYVKLNKDSVILNLGIASGFEIPYFLSFDVQKVFNVDPLGDLLLDRYVREWESSFPGRLEFINEAISQNADNIELRLSEDMYKRFNGPSEGKTAEVTPGINNSFTKKFKAIRMEDLLKKLNLSRLDLLKVDIEGGENSVLEGAEAPIKKFRPQIAFSIYHNNRDFFEMPLRLMGMCQSYNFYCKTYTYEKYDTILYCIPKEIDN